MADSQLVVVVDLGGPTIQKFSVPTGVTANDYIATALARGFFVLPKGSMSSTMTIIDQDTWVPTARLISVAAA